MLGSFRLITVLSADYDRRSFWLSSCVAARQPAVSAVLWFLPGWHIQTVDRRTGRQGVLFSAISHGSKLNRPVLLVCNCNSRSVGNFSKTLCTRYVPANHYSCVSHLCSCRDCSRERQNQLHQACYMHQCLTVAPLHTPAVLTDCAVAWHPAKWYVQQCATHDLFPSAGHANPPGPILADSGTNLLSFCIAQLQGSRELPQQHHIDL